MNPVHTYTKVSFLIQFSIEFTNSTRQNIATITVLPNEKYLAGNKCTVF